MNDKQIYDLTRSDIDNHPVWYFPMDDSVEDELTVRPKTPNCHLGDHQIIIKTNFKDIDGKEYIGYIYWCKPDSIEGLKPVVFTNESECVTFWNGVIPVSWKEYNLEKQVLSRSLPIKFTSIESQDLGMISGELEGLYYLDGTDIKFA